jgi:4-hydroxythreonine-4-phosphate dehydrogenase
MAPSIPRIVITPGEPAGIGPDIVLQLACQDILFPAELIVISDPDLLMARAKSLSLSVELIACDLTKPAKKHLPGTLKIIPISLKAPCIPGQINCLNSAFVIHSLSLAVDFCLENKVEAFVTGPVNKAAMNMAGIPFTGHTEFLAARCHVNDVLMLFVVNQLRVALATTHIPLAQVPSAITISHLTKTLHLLDRELKNKFDIKKPRILVAGLNPHAGEEGLLGREEINIITPVIHQLQTDHIDVQGPFPADTLFTKKYLPQADAILAMYHDQALPVVKYMGFSHAVNVTLGLPIIRTSVDHGTALDIAGTNQADPGSLMAALHLAIELAVRRSSAPAVSR